MAAPEGDWSSVSRPQSAAAGPPPGNSALWQPGSVSVDGGEVADSAQIDASTRAPSLFQCSATGSDIIVDQPCSDRRPTTIPVPPDVPAADRRGLTQDWLQHQPAEGELPPVPEPDMQTDDGEQASGPE
eukprot:Hpha_TRINITY_DN9027_c0_g1::TRINITY_DN9027_c0_g1_i1::g.141708::m.141708